MTGSEFDELQESEDSVTTVFAEQKRPELGSLARTYQNRRDNRRMKQRQQLRRLPNRIQNSPVVIQLQLSTNRTEAVPGFQSSQFRTIIGTLTEAEARTGEEIPATGNNVVDLLAAIEKTYEDTAVRDEKS